MNKKQFINVLEKRLAPLPPQERRELISDVESHFLIGIQNGRSEEDIARELGDPNEMARDALGDRFPNHTVNAGRSKGISGKIATRTGLFFCGMLVVPLLITLWAGGVSLGLITAASVASPVLVMLDYVISGDFFPAKFFLSLALLGAGILISFAVRSIYAGLKAVSKKYIHWNKKWIGGDDYEA